MSKDQDDYTTLLNLGREIRLLSSLSMLLDWDQETYMPKRGIDFRSQQKELISSLLHSKKVSSTFRDALSRLIDIESGKVAQTSLGAREQAALREWRRDYLIEVKLPSDFVKTFAKTTSQAVTIWAEAKKNNDFETFLPHLEKIVSLVQEKAKYIGWKEHPYDALIDLYEPGMTTKKLDAFFAELKPFLTDLLGKLSSKKRPDTSFLSAYFPEDKQEEFNHTILAEMGVDPSSSRLDYSDHPFCMGLHPHDVRLTTHTSGNCFFEGISAVMHEGGHALYELGLPSKDLGSPNGDYCSMGMHESQSRWWETYIGLGLPFWKFAFPKLKAHFPNELASVDLDHFYQAINVVEPSLIRIFADEVTYILHIILRYELEKEFLEGTINLSELPAIWNQKMKDSLGVVPETDSEGCLQDIHWAWGLFGYFPTYALGNVYAGQLYQTFQQTFPDWEKRIAGGDLAFMREFLKQNVHRFGREFPALDLIERATGSPLSPEPYISYLKHKYL
ncbi:MAG: Thermostable carboxypeptidase 1 [Chlamydiae bacterium]|nr:Thermostable carboxypeptidase 1 [Chlamydiota bacterium]